MAIRKKVVGDTILQVIEDEYGRYKTSVCRVEKLESNTIYLGYEKQMAIELFEECHHRFNIDEVDSLDEIQWSRYD